MVFFFLARVDIVMPTTTRGPIRLDLLEFLLA